MYKTKITVFEKQDSDFVLKSSAVLFVGSSYLVELCIYFQKLFFGKVNVMHTKHACKTKNRKAAQHIYNTFAHCGIFSFFLLFFFCIFACGLICVHFLRECEYGFRPYILLQPLKARFRPSLQHRNRRNGQRLSFCPEKRRLQIILPPVDWSIP